LADIEIPRMVRLRQRFPADRIEDVAGTVARKLRERDFGDRIKSGMRVTLTGSSREVRNMNVVLREIAAFVKERGGQPYIVPAMGSHGGATAEGQKAILDDFGVTESFCGCPIHSSMETALVGRTDDGLPVYLDKFAAESDAVIPVGRIKGHTAFRAPYESGLFKMLAIGLGKQKGADSLHDMGFGAFKERIPAFAKVVLANANVVFGVGLIENAFDETCRIEVIRGEDIEAEEPPLLDYAKARMPRLFFKETDVLVVREIGKNFSGSGMDPNVTGTWATPYGGGGIAKQKTVVLDVTDKSHGNAMGVGMADVTTMRLFHKIDFTALYPNMLTSTVIAPGKIPMVMEDDELAIRAAIKTCTGIDKRWARIVYIKNTLNLEEVFVSEAMVEEASRTEGIDILEGPRPFRFDGKGNLLDLA
jgi:hypothetical protein